MRERQPPTVRHSLLCPAFPPTASSGRRPSELSPELKGKRCVHERQPRTARHTQFACERTPRMASILEVSFQRRESTLPLFCLIHASGIRIAVFNGRIFPFMSVFLMEFFVRDLISFLVDGHERHETDHAEACDQDPGAVLILPVVRLNGSSGSRTVPYPRRWKRVLKHRKWNYPPDRA